MKVLWAVIHDLLKFPFQLFLRDSSKQKPEAASILLLSPKPEPTLELVVPAEDFARVSSAVQIEPTREVFPALTDASVAYISSKTAKIMQGPQWSYDTVLAEYNYGKAVHILGYDGRFARIVFANESAWVLKDDISTNINDVFPVFVEGNIYLSADKEVKKLRKLIKDQYFTEMLYLPLQGIEYVAYILGQHNLSLPEIAVRPRVAGSIHINLRGHRGVHIGITPKTGSVLEYKDENGVGQIGYVEAVYPDGSIYFSIVGLQSDGKFSKQKLSKEVWLALQPVFIQVL